MPPAFYAAGAGSRSESVEGSMTSTNGGALGHNRRELVDMTEAALT
jgi:hypothetical protein